MVRIVADSTCDLSDELLDKYDITIVPLHIVLDEKEFRDEEEICADEIYQWVEENQMLPKTSAVALEDVLEIMEPMLEVDDEIIVLCISEEMSTTANIFRMAAEELGALNKVTVVNSENLSTGIGHLVIEAAIMAKEGRCRKEILEKIDVLKPMVRSSFVVDTLSYLQRGGRCSSVSALAGGMLNIHPMIVVQNGTMEAGKKYRGKMPKVIIDYVRDLELELKRARTERVFVTHSGCEQELIDLVYEYLNALNYFDEILVTRAGGVISSHCGPGTLGVLYIATKDSVIYDGEDM